MKAQVKAEVKAEVNAKNVAEVKAEVLQGNINAEDKRVGNIDDANASKIHNPTIEKEAEKLTEKFNGKRSFRSLASTFWCENNEERDKEFERVCNIWPSSKYILYGPVETTEENKKNHCHIVICFGASKLWKTIIKTLPCNKYHHEPCRNCNSAREYALKTDPKNGKEYGTPLQQGNRIDLKHIMEKHNYSVEAIRNDDPSLYSRYRNGITDCCNDYNNKQNILEWLNVKKEDNTYIEKKYSPTIVHWFYGPTGCGKTRKVKQIISNYLIKGKITEKDISIINKIENGFAIGNINENTKVLVLDEFRGSSMKYSDLLSLIDGCNINIKGGKIFIKAKIIFITSCHSPDECYPTLSYNDSINQLKRRIKTKYFEYTHGDDSTSNLSFENE